jgi:hypothetical protein
MGVYSVMAVCNLFWPFSLYLFSWSLISLRQIIEGFFFSEVVLWKIRGMHGSPMLGTCLHLANGEQYFQSASVLKVTVKLGIYIFSQALFIKQGYIQNQST